MLTHGDWHDFTLSILECTEVMKIGGSRLSRTAVKPDFHLAQIFVAKFLFIIKLIIIIG